jgi:hypothetical protein
MRSFDWLVFKEIVGHLLDFGTLLVFRNISKHFRLILQYQLPIIRLVALSERIVKGYEIVSFSAANVNKQNWTCRRLKARE